MDIQQVKDERRKLATSVQAIDLIHLITDANEFPVKTQVAIKVELTNN